MPRAKSKHQKKSTTRADGTKFQSTYLYGVSIDQQHGTVQLHFLKGRDQAGLAILDGKIQALYASRVDADRFARIVVRLLGKKLRATVRRLPDAPADGARRSNVAPWPYRVAS